MKKKENNSQKKSRQHRKHPIGQRLIVGILCICLSLVSLPIDQYGSLALAAQSQEIVMFPALSQEVRVQAVQIGTEEAELNLPEALTAVCRVQEEIPVEIQPEVIETEAMEQASDIQSQTEENASEAEEPLPEVGAEPSVPEEPALSEEPLPPADTPATGSELEQNQTETVTIYGITWVCEPEYEKEKEGFYTFSPVIPESYSLAEGVELPEITVALMGKKEQENTEQGYLEERKEKAKEIKQGRAKESQTELAVLAEDEETPAAPSCGRITKDTVWEEKGVLNTGELIVDPGVTLTIKEEVSINGSVTVKGGGTIVRGSGNSVFSIISTSKLTLEDITLEGNLISGSSMIRVRANTTFIMNTGSRIQNCVSNSGGAIENAGGEVILNGGEIYNCSADVGGAITVNAGGTLTIEYATIEDCSAAVRGGAIYENGNAKVIIKDGRFINNKTTDDSAYWSGGGFLCLCTASLEIYGGEFINNTSVSYGGCIHHCGCSGTQTNINGGYFAGNTCTREGYEGSGAIYYSTKYTGTSNSITLSGKVQFCGDGSTASGTDGVYLDSKNDANILRKIRISDTLSYPVNLYVSATEGRVIAEGVHEYRLLRERDMKKINFIDVGDSSKIWYAVLDEEKNEVQVSEVKPDYGYYVYYVSPETEETVVDDQRYEKGDMVQVKSADILNLEGHKFIEWNTNANGSGTSYHPGDTFLIQDDTDLFAVFESETKVKELTADFYSGSAGQKETKTVMLKADAESGSVETPQLEDMEEEGWTPLGWNAAEDQYTGDITPGEKITLTEDKAYYGVYQKDVALSYVANQADICPENAVEQKYANVHEEISTVPAEFAVAPAAARYGYAFTGWNTEPDGTGKTYREGEVLKTETDMTLYAVFKKPLHAFFYSGGAGEKEEIIVDIPEDAVSGIVTTPDLKEFKELQSPAGAEALSGEGWEPVGWDLEKDSYAGEIQPGEELVLTDDAIYYGVYRKEVSLSYYAVGVEDFTEEEAGECRANVHEETVKSLAEFTIAAGPNRLGSAFIGWNTKPDGSGDSYQEGEVLRIEEDTVLYAVFQKTLSASFYSGSEGRADVRSAVIAEDENSVKVEAPELKELEGWTPVGWDTDSSGYVGGIQEGEELTLTEDREYYGVYKKDVTLSYEGESGDGSGEVKQCHVNVHKGGISQAPAEFILMEEPERSGYRFLGWNTEPDGSGKSYAAGSSQGFVQDTVLYASWEAKTLPYRVEHYQQEPEGNRYVLAEAEELSALMGSKVEGKAKTYPGFTESMEHSLRRTSGTVQADGGLTLRFFYDRDVYEVDFDLNGGEGEEPEPQSVRYGGLLQPVEVPERQGYNFKGWYLDRKGSLDSQWDFGRTVEENTSDQMVTLYAKWADETAPVLGKVSYGKGHRSLFHWVLHKESLKITVPIKEEGSGVKEAEYILEPEKTEGKKQARIGAEYTTLYGSIGMPVGVSAGGKISQTVKGKARVRTRDGEIKAEFSIPADFKGKVLVTSTDRAGNVSAKKSLTAENGGIIVEDNAPQIQFQADSLGQKDGAVSIQVTVKDDIEGNVSGGIASVSYQTDGEQITSVGEKEFQKAMVESYDFTVKVTGAGSHRLGVKAVDNAGNESSGEITVDIRGEEKPLAKEPKTGDGHHVEIFATASMIAGFSYLFLYFKEHGMTEEKKEELVSRLVSWAKGKGKLQRMAALALIFLVLAYYHSMGRKVPEGWREVYEK